MHYVSLNRRTSCRQINHKMKSTEISSNSLLPRLPLSCRSHRCRSPPPPPPHASLACAFLAARCALRCASSAS